MAHRPIRRRTAALAVVILIVVGLLASELVVRMLMTYNTPETLRAYSLEYQGAVYARSRLAPMNRLVQVDVAKAWGTKPGDAPSERTFHINDLGFRGPTFSPRKPPRTTRVFVVGGSAVFDQNVSDDEASEGRSWPNRAQTLLRQRGFDVEVINAGTPGHSTIDAIGRLTSELWLYEPDVVLLYEGWNDVKNFRATALSPERPLARLIRPFDGTADPYRNYRGRIDRLLCTSQLYVKFRNLYLARTLHVGSEGILPTGATGSDYGAFGPRQYEQNLRNFTDVVRNMGARPVLATQATLVFATDSASKARIGRDYQLLDEVGLARAFDDLYRITRDVGRAKGVPLLDAGALLNGRPELLADHVHLTPAGSEVMAQLLADFLVAMLQAPAPAGR